MLHSPDSDSVESSCSGAVVVVVSVESVMVVHRLVIDLTLRTDVGSPARYRWVFKTLPENRLLSSLLIDPDVPCVDVGVTVGVVDSGGDPVFQFLAVRGADVSRSWIEREVRCPALSAGRVCGHDKMGVTSIHAVMTLKEDRWQKASYRRRRVAPAAARCGASRRRSGA